MHLGFEQGIPIFAPPYEHEERSTMYRQSFILVFSRCTVKDIILDMLPENDEDRQSKVVTEGYVNDKLKVFSKTVSINDSNYPEKIATIRSTAARTILSHFGEDSRTPSPLAEVIQIKPPSTP